MTIRDDEWVVCPFCQHQMGDCFDWCKSEYPQRTTCDSCGDSTGCKLLTCKARCRWPEFNRRNVIR